MSSITSLVTQLATQSFNQFIQTTKVEDWLKKGVDAWLATGDSSGDGLYGNVATSSGVMGHWSNIIGTNAMMLGVPFGEGHKYVAQSFPDDKSFTASEIEKYTNQLLYMPNIEGIPIFTKKVGTAKRTIVSQRTVISSQTNSKEVRIDNAAPQLRTWDIEGYLQSMIPQIDAFTFIKSSIVEQSNLLWTFMDTRRPVWFKSQRGEFVQVLITDYEEENVPDNSSCFAVHLKLIEFKPLRFSSVGVSIEKAVESEGKKKK